MSGAGRDEFQPDAQQVSLDNSDIDCLETAENVHEGFQEICSIIGNGASPGYPFGREGVHAAGTWLIYAETTTNKRGCPFGLSNGSIRKITLCTRNNPDIYSVEVWYHNGDLSGATLVGTVTTTGPASIEDFSVNWSVPQNVQLAVKISSTTGTKPQETGVFIVTKGSLV